MKGIRQPAHHRGRGPGRLAGLLMALLVVLGLSGSTAIASPDGTPRQAASAAKVPARAMDAVAAMQPSWNLGNTLDAIPDETSWGNPQGHQRAVRDHPGGGLPQRPHPGDLERTPVRHRALHHRRRVHEPRQAGGRLGAGREPVRRAQRPPRLVAVDLEDAHRPRHGARPLQLPVDPDRRGDSGTLRAPCSSRASTSRCSTTPRTPRRPSSSTSSTSRSTRSSAPPAAATRTVCSSSPRLAHHLTSASWTTCPPRSGR